MRVLFIHNTLPEYRINWFKEMEKKSDVEYFFTSIGIYKKKYNFEVEESSLKNARFMSKGVKGFADLLNVLKKIDDYDFIELPPIDNLREFLVSFTILYYCKLSRKKIKFGYFWEKWEAPRFRQPFLKKVKNFIVKYAARMIYANVDVVFAGSRMSKKYFLKNKVEEKKIKLLPNCCELNDCKYEDIRVKYKIDNRMKCILYFGRVMKEKGLDILIKAFSKLPEGKFFLLVVGDGPFLDSCKGLARKLGLVNIHFAGSINPQIRKNYFQQCDIFVLPGTYYKGWVDVWGLTIGEAIQFDKIVISTYGVGSAIDLIKNGLNGFIVQPENVKELVESIERSEFISERSIEKVDKEIRKIYSAQNLASNYLECVRESCEK